MANPNRKSTSAAKKTMALKPAYDVYDAGVAALADHRPKDALANAEEAISLFPDEGHGFAKPENRLRFYAAAERFLAKHLGGRHQTS